VLNDAKTAGFNGGVGDVFISGHSLGGAGARYLVDKEPRYAGLALFGTQYNSQANSGEVTPGYPADLLAWSQPLLAVSGELDMMPVTHMAALLTQYDELSPAAKKRKVPIIIPGMDHSQFCPGFDVVGDNVAEISNAEAAQAVGAVTAAWLDLQVLPDGITAAASELLASMVESTTRPILGAFMEAARNEPAAYCAKAQLFKANLPAEYNEQVHIVVKTLNSSANTEHFHPNASMNTGARSGNGANSLTVSIGSYPFYDQDDKYSPLKFIPSYVGARDITCKMLSSAAIGKWFGIPPAKDATGKEISPKSCREVNQVMVAEAEALLNKYWPKTMSRFAANSGRPFVLLADEETFMGPQFIFISKLNFDTNKDPKSVQVTSPALFSALDSRFFPGSDYCKILSPAKVIEWYMTKGLVKRLPVPSTKAVTYI